MESSINVTSTKNWIQIESKGFNTATINGIRRTMLLNVQCYGFDEFIAPDDYKIIFKSKPTPRHCVLVDTLSSQPIPILAQRVSRIPIFLSNLTEPLITSTSNRNVFFVVSRVPDDNKDIITSMQVPLTDVAADIYSRDLTPVVLVKSNDDDNWEYDNDSSLEVQKHIADIFPFNVLVARIKFGERLNIIMKPILGTGLDNSRWSPCTFRYGYTIDPKWGTDRKMNVAENSTLRRKVEGNLPFKYLYTHDPETNKPYDRFGKPYGHKMRFQYNGKMGHVDAFKKSINTLIESCNHFLKMYLKASKDRGSTEPTLIHIEESTVSSDDGTYNSKVELLFIPRNTQDKLNPNDMALTDHTIGNLITSKVREIIGTMIRNDSLWSQTNIAYKVPHKLIPQCMMLFKIPESLDITHQDLLKRTVNEIKIDLNKIKSAIVDHISINDNETED